MGLEIERRFLVSGDGYRTAAEGSQCFQQGYLSTVPGRTVRVRLAGERATLTIKGPSRGPVRAEFEYAIPAADARELLILCVAAVISKTRHFVRHAGHLWEVDEFHGANAGLVIAECELVRPDEPLTTPDWVGPEVTGDHRYANSSLAEHPFGSW